MASSGSESVAGTPPRKSWTLWRQDDHGNRFLIERFDDEARARAALASYEALAHKQSYWIEARAE